MACIEKYGNSGKLLLEPNSEIPVMWYQYVLMLNGAETWSLTVANKELQTVVNPLTDMVAK